jgi:hypothetical protein
LSEIMPLLKLCLDGQRREVPDKHRAEVTPQLSSWIELSKWPAKSWRQNDVHKAPGDISNLLGSGFSVDCARGLLVVIADHRTYPESRARASAPNYNANATTNSANNSTTNSTSDSNSTTNSYSCAPERGLDNIALFDANQSSTRHPSEYWECAVRDGFWQLSA